ncbi:MAG TPA: hypothetical protein PLE83_10375, partial [Myxococcota bacterium]|nr:hypothetical protein [Myxococcota bacterium]
CTCVEDTGPGDENPCGADLNPSCDERECDLDDGTEGVCQNDGSGCQCVKKTDPNPCGADLNPSCEDRECELDDGTEGVCKLDGGNSCVCGEKPPQNPCGLKLNPLCEDRACDLGDGTQGVCQRSGKNCFCADATPPDPCGSELNPTCDDRGCTTVDNRPGTCKKLGRLCFCIAAEPADPCSSNLQCTSAACTTSDGLKGNCGWVFDLGGGGRLCVCKQAPDSCHENIDCVGLAWPESCSGHWECQSGTCKATCENTSCGDKSCIPEDGESKLSCPSDCNCSTDSDCGLSSQYCKFAIGRCEEPGTCSTKPSKCAPAQDPVCGCNDNNYTSSCLAAKEGVSIKATGLCGHF